jgi:hypothetical protein
MTESLIALEQGRLIAERYRLLRPLGTGGSAHVWAARDQALGREVALKVLSGSSAQGGRERERLRREARLLALLDHPRITTVYDYVETVEPDDTHHPVLVTELLAGVTLDARLKQGPLPVENALEVCADVADALAAAHVAGIVHRDVKPGNVMLTSDGAKLLDFGISRRAVDADLTGPVLIGTPACMAPEQWRGQSSRPASDVYALGCLLYWCLSGHAPYAERELPALGLAHLMADPPELPAGVGGGTAIAELYSACTRKDPDRRPSALEAARVLSGDAPAYATVADGAARTQIADAAPTVPAPRTHRVWRTASATATAAVLGAAVAIAVTWSGSTSPAGALTGIGATPSSSTTTRAVSHVSGDATGDIDANAAAVGQRQSAKAPAGARTGIAPSAQPPAGKTPAANGGPIQTVDPASPTAIGSDAASQAPQPGSSETAGDPGASTSPSGDASSSAASSEPAPGTPTAP